MHCRIHQITPPKLGWMPPLSPFPRPTPPHHTHPLFLLRPSHQSAGLVACSCIVLCWEGARADGGVLVWPADSRFNRRPRVQGDVDEQFFSFLSPFQKRLSSFSVSVGAVEVIRESAGRPERAPQTQAILPSNVVLKWEVDCCDWCWEMTRSTGKNGG